MAKIQTCPKCRALLEPGIKTCPYCQTDQRHVAAPGPAADAAATTRLGAWILAVNVVVFFLTVQFDPLRGDERGLQLKPSHQSLVGFGSSEAGPVGECGQYWRLLTANFLHLDLLHLVLNSIAALILIQIAAITFGAHRTLCIYFLAGVCGFFVSYMRGHNSAGASAALCGLIGALAVYGKRRNAPDLTRRMLMWCALILVIGLVAASSRALPRIDNWGHGGGLAGGALLGWPASGVRARGSREDRLWRTGAVVWLAACALVAVVWQVPSIVRNNQRREVELYWNKVQRTLMLLDEVSAGLKPADRLPASFRAGPADSGALARAMRAAIDETRQAPGADTARAAKHEAHAAWRAWEGKLACSHYMRWVPR